MQPKKSQETQVQPEATASDKPKYLLVPTRVVEQAAAALGQGYYDNIRHTVITSLQDALLSSQPPDQTTTE